LFKHVPAGWSGWSVLPKRCLPVIWSVGWADERSRVAGWPGGPAGHVEARRATRAAVMTEVASRVTRRPAARVV
jgi:hypothetical protein